MVVVAVMKMCSGNVFKLFQDEKKKKKSKRRLSFSSSEARQIGTGA